MLTEFLLFTQKLIHCNWVRLWTNVLLVCAFLQISHEQHSRTIAANSPDSFSLNQQNTFLNLPQITLHLPVMYHHTSCTRDDQFGTMLLNEAPGDWISPADVMIDIYNRFGIKGLVAAGAPSDKARDEWFGMLDGSTRIFLKGTYDQLVPVYASASAFDMEEMYECIGYGPESMHQAGQEALEPLTWVPMAETVAESTGKCLVYGPAVADYERMTTSAGEIYYDPALLSQLITSVSPHVDIWMIQLAKYQRWMDAGRDDSGNLFTMQDFKDWVGWWVEQIKTGNPDALVWTQLGIGVYDPIQKKCLPPQPVEYFHNYRMALSESGVDGVFAMPSQSCQLSEDPQDHEYYLQTISYFQETVYQACGH